MVTDLHPLLAASLILILGLAVNGDLRERRIPNWLSLGGLGLGIALQLALHGAAGFSVALQGALTGGLMLLPLWLLRGMAAGDVKLMAAVGAHLGPMATLIATLATLVLGALIALAVWIRQARRREPAAANTFPYAPAIAAGTLLALSLPLLKRTWTG